MSEEVEESFNAVVKEIEEEHAKVKAAVQEKVTKAKDKAASALR